MDERTILFVDQDLSLLQGLRRMLRKMRPAWTVALAHDAASAMALLRETPPDMVIAEIRMSGRDGISLLRKVKERDPSIIRLILSGYSDTEMSMRSLGVAHQVLCKPCEPDELIRVLSRAMALRDLLCDKGLQTLLGGIERVPSLPSFYLRMQEELDRPEPDLDRISETIEKDMGMTVKVLQLANSSFFGLSRRLSNAREAVVYLGTETLKAMVILYGVFSLFDEKMIARCRLTDFWEHSILVAKAAKALAEAEHCPRGLVNDTFAAGILHDMGKLIFAGHFQDTYLLALDLGKREALGEVEAEQGVFKATHAEVGAYLMGLWGLPQRVVEAVAFHHRPSECHHQEPSPLTFVHAADVFAGALRKGPQGPRGNALDRGYVEALGKADRIPVWESLCGDLERRMG